jgi:hypothetical protein
MFPHFQVMCVKVLRNKNRERARETGDETSLHKFLADIGLQYLHIFVSDTGLQ